MRSETALINSLPQFLQNIREFKALIGLPEVDITENKDKESTGAAGYLVNELWDNIEKSTYGQIPEYADKDGIMCLEKRYKLSGGIINTDEELAERRTRLINRVSLRPPYTLGKVKEQLETIVDGDVAEIDYNSDYHTLTIKAPSVTEELKTEVKKTLRRMIPASIGYTVTSENNWALISDKTWDEASKTTWKGLKG